MTAWTLNKVEHLCLDCGSFRAGVLNLDTAHWTCHSCGHTYDLNRPVDDRKSLPS